LGVEKVPTARASEKTVEKVGPHNRDEMLISSGES